MPEITRRELLTWLVGAPLAAEACRRAPRDYPGEIRGANLALGHRLRKLGDATLEQARGPVVSTGTLIVGGGVSGLSAAWRLERLGARDFIVLELEQEPGGTAVSGRDGVVPYPWGAHYVPVPSRDNRALTALLDELGVIERNAAGEIVGKERHLVREPEERVFAGAEWHEGLFPVSLASPADHDELRRFQREVERWVAFRDARGRRAFALPMRASSDDAAVTELDRISAAAWLGARGFKSKLVRWYVEYACRDDYGLALEQTSAWAMLFYFASRMPAPGRPTAEFLAWPEGNGRLVAHLAKVAGPRLALGQLVTDIVPGDDAVEVCAFDAARGALVRYRAEAVIVAAPKFVLPRMLRPWRDRPPAHLSGFSYGSWLVANLHLSRRPRSSGYELAWDNVIYDSPSLGYVVATHQQLADHGPTIFTYYQPLTDPDPKRARDRLAQLEHRDAARAIVSDLARAHVDLEACIERIDVWRWGHAMVRPVPGFIWGSARKKAAEPYGRIRFAHSDLSGLALFEEAQDWGVRAAEDVVRARGRSFDSLLG